MSEPYTGGCACGAIRYRIAADPVTMVDCQHMSGTGHGSYLIFTSREAAQLDGDATRWDAVGDSGNVKTRAFCPTCGAPVYLTLAAMPDMLIVHAASLDDPSRYAPQAVTYHARGHAWDHFDPNVPSFERMPPM